VQQEVVLHPTLRKTTAVLDLPNPAAPCGTTRVYILAVSHVSAVSCDQVRELIRAVQPQIVMVEVCKDRLGLLATDFPPGPRVWHCPNIKVSGVPEGSGFPTAADLRHLLICKPGRPFTSEDIEADVRTLQATGLFATVRPSALSGTQRDAPMFTVSEDTDGEVRIDTVAPFNIIEFRCEQRSLPPITAFDCRVSSKAAAAGIEVPPARMQSLQDATLAMAQKGDSSTVAVLMGVRARIQAEVGGLTPVDVEFNNVENGQVEAVVVLKCAEGVHTGLEGSVEGGEGFGIEPFQNPNRGNDVKIGLTSSLPADIVEAIARSASVIANFDENERTADGAAAIVNVGQLQPGGGLEARVAKGRGKMAWRPWTWKEAALAAEEDLEPQPLKDLLAETLTEWYGGLQRTAGATVGLQGGAAWRVCPLLTTCRQSYLA
jgi:hypothetical protein